MGWLQDYGSYILRDLGNGVKDGLKSIVTGKPALQVRRERKELERRAARVEALRNKMGDAAWKVYQDEKRKIARLNDRGTKTPSIQYQDTDAKIKVSSGYSGSYDCWVADIKVINRDPEFHEHLHIIIDEWGEVIYEQWNNDDGYR
ncbi:MAG: hypothetical protein PVI21_01835 [Candidatus Woesebacteria bacterium]|jgi:hypothetical protein